MKKMKKRRDKKAIITGITVAARECSSPLYIGIRVQPRVKIPAIGRTGGKYED